ncbi:DISARM system phospholipase D-like protein DrmC [Gordonia sp. HY442]|uniref:DISARM system phospholipase D-like protein DrmC n=1 Tax=Gordonia zhenghanii TaxID=2911516 RepID=UPI001F41ED91|nr:DISARM system phospholipase D-like protein DrmC [Gordonia zhenghanii]MCF8604013.1 DISARM system phospholipase D-like protein DrmC [Gordonia zhenghanii]
MTPVARLGELLVPAEAGAIAAALRLQGLPHLAAQRAFAVNRAEVRILLAALLSEAGSAELAAAVLDGIAAVPRGAGPEPVWTAPTVPGLGGRTTLAAAELINRATTTVFAATYSASAGSDYVQALAHAIDRGVAVTVIVDRGMQLQNGGVIPKALADARVWTYAPEPVGEYVPLQHAKLVVVDRASALVTSANFSNAAAKLNLECGLLSHDAALADDLVRQLETLYEHGALVAY